MKQIQTFLKALSFLFIFLFANSLYSGTCGAGYDFTYAPSVTNCGYGFVPVLPDPTINPAVSNIEWTLSSTGTYGCVWDNVFSDTFGLSYVFCFYGTYDVIMTIHFASGATCTVSHQIYEAKANCNGLFCNPDPGNDSIPDPLVEITYKGPDTCNFNSVSIVSGCMYSGITGTSHYYIACGWKWALRIPASIYNCDIFTYYVQYSEILSCGSYQCTRLTLDTTVQCIKAQIGQPIYIVATATGCCMPAGYQRGFIWTPNTSGLNPISNPGTQYGSCQNTRRCPNGHSGNCNEAQQTMGATSGWPASCFTGGKHSEQRDKSTLIENANIEQMVIIYNIQGIEVFNGSWKFGDPGNLYLNWPNGIGSGLYFVKFLNAEGKGLTKLYKF